MSSGQSCPTGHTSLILIKISTLSSRVLIAHFPSKSKNGAPVGVPHFMVQRCVVIDDFDYEAKARRQASPFLPQAKHSADPGAWITRASRTGIWQFTLRQ